VVVVLLIGVGETLRVLIGGRVGLLLMILIGVGRNGIVIGGRIDQL
jgi:hypothetical protein